MEVQSNLLPVSSNEILQLQQSVFTVLHHLVCVQMLHQTRQNPTTSEHNNPHQTIQRENPVAVIQGNSHGVSTADVFAGSLDDRLAGFIERSVDAVVCSGVCFLDQSLELRMDATTVFNTKLRLQHRH